MTTDLVRPAPVTARQQRSGLAAAVEDLLISFIPTRGRCVVYDALNIGGPLVIAMLAAWLTQGPGMPWVLRAVRSEAARTGKANPYQLGDALVMTAREALVARVTVTTRLPERVLPR